MKSRHALPVSLLIATALIWGSTFSLMKNTLDRINVPSFLGWRFLIAALLMAIAKPKVFKVMDKEVLIKGTVIGAILSAGFLFQTYGLTHTTVAKTGFITGLYAAFVPLIGAFIFKDKVGKYQWVAVGLSTIGLAFLSLNGFSVGLGEFLVLCSAIAYALHIIVLGHWAPGKDAYALTMLQLGTNGVICTAFAVKSGFQVPPDHGVWAAIIFCAIFASALAFMVQTWSQSFMSATNVAVIVTLEFIFAAIFGVLFSHEHLTWRTLAGGSFVMSGLYLIIYLDSQKEIA